jgi:excinuclease ABC subunit C
MFNMEKKLASALKALPTLPGIYIFKDLQEEVIYIGKAANLRSRVKSYFQDNSKLSDKTRQLVTRIDNMEFVVTESEIAALVLESQQIKKHRPHFNVLLKDDKSFPYIKIDIKDPWPTISITRKRHADGARYIGRVPSAWSARQTYDLIKKIFPLRSCHKTITGKDTRPCLNFHIRRCLSPCTGSISQAEYNSMVQHVISFLEGREDQVLHELSNRMKEASDTLQYEKAAHIRNQINAINAVIESNSIPFNISGKIDIVALARDDGLACVQLFAIRDNKLRDEKHYIIQGISSETDANILESFIKQYYLDCDNLPSRILLPCQLGDADLIRNWLRRKKGSTVTMRVPGKGTHLRLLKLVTENAHQQLNMFIARRPARPEALKALSVLQEKLGMAIPPSRIEAYDISNIQGALSVGSMVVFENGLPRPAQYRRFRIKQVGDPDDYAMMREVLSRRFKVRQESESNWMAMPDLIIIDGGKGHLKVAVETLKSAGKSGIPIISIAKEHEDIFSPFSSSPLDIDKNSLESHLLQKIRDEAHRFAVTYHRQLRSKRSKESALDSIEGIGNARRKALIKRFGSVHNIRRATIEDLMEVEGISRKVAERILKALA